MENQALFFWGAAGVKRPFMSAGLGMAFFKCLAPASGARTEAARHIENFNHLCHLLGCDRLHHATYRNIGTVWEGLWFYAKSVNGFRGYDVAGCVAKESPFSDAAHAMVRHTGVSVGSYGNG